MDKFIYVEFFVDELKRRLKRDREITQLTAELLTFKKDLETIICTYQDIYNRHKEPISFLLDNYCLKEEPFFYLWLFLQIRLEHCCELSLVAFKNRICKQALGVIESESTYKMEFFLKNRTISFSGLSGVVFDSAIRSQLVNDKLDSTRSILKECCDIFCFQQFYHELNWFLRVYGEKFYAPKSKKRFSHLITYLTLPTTFSSVMNPYFNACNGEKKEYFYRFLPKISTYVKRLKGRSNPLK